MQFNQPSLVPITPTVQRDPATRRFGIVFLATLGILTIGVAIGIGVGNLAHYNYFPPNNQTNIPPADLFNITNL